MNSIEIVIVLLLLFMAVPDACRWFGRPALIYPAFVTFGLLLGPLVQTEVETMIQQAGEIGFLLLLFEVGLEIDLPRPRDLIRAASYTARWVVVQYPIIVALARFAGLPWLESFIAAAAITGCSVGMAHTAWKNYPGLSDNTRTFALRIMVLLEVLAIVLLSVETTVLDRGISWFFTLKITGIGLVIFLCSRISVPLAKVLQIVLAKTTHWRLHFVALLVLAVCAIGERLGLPGPKTAFFLGLFMSRVEHEGKHLEEYLAPISKRFLIPIFFVALGMQIPIGLLFSRAALLAVAAAGLVIVYREMIHRRWLRSGGNAGTYLLFCPNLTIVALAASSMLKAHHPPEQAAWVVLTGLFITTSAVLALPSPLRQLPESRSELGGPLIESPARK
jgi:Kef-type K+ transport system membrane component KefB